MDHKDRKKQNTIWEYILIGILALLLIYKMFFGGCGCSTPDNSGVPDDLAPTTVTQTN